MSELMGIEVMEDGYGGRVRLAISDFEDGITRQLPRNLQFGPHEPIGPLFGCSDDQATHLGESYCMPALDHAFAWRTGMVPHRTGLAVKEMGDWRSVWCGVPNLPSSLLRGIARKAGVHIYLDGDDVVYANALFLSVHARYAGLRQVALPAPATVVDAYTRQKIAERARTFGIYLERGETGSWLLE
jgi:hypothetical protein